MILLVIILLAVSASAETVSIAWGNPNAIKNLEFRVYNSPTLTSTASGEKSAWICIAKTDQLSLKLDVKSLDSYFYVTAYDPEKQEESRPSNIIRGRNIVSQKATSTRMGKATLTFR